MLCDHSCTTTCRCRSLKPLYGLIDYFNVNISNLLIFVSAVFICCYNFCGGIFPVLKTNLEKHFCHKADSCTFMNVLRSSSRLSCFWLRGEKDQHSEALNSVPDSEGSVPKQRAHIFPFLNCKLDAFGHISSRLVPVPCFPCLLIHSFNTIFFYAYFPFLNSVHLCFSVCLSYYQTALPASPRINFCIAVSLIYRPILHSWPTVLRPTLCALPVPVSFIWQTFLQFVSLPLLQLPGFWTYLINKLKSDWKDPQTLLQIKHNSHVGSF